MKAFIYITFILFLGCSASTDSGGFDEAIGTVAPEFMYTSTDGQEIALSDFRGKVVYIFFYGAGCPHCRSNGSVTENINQRFTSNSDFVALGLDTWNTSVSQNISFQNATGITYSLLLNARQSLVDYYGNAGAYDRSVVVDPTGRIAYKGSGFVNTDSEKVISVIQEQLNSLNQ
ncbi:MAG: TlpA family protein disulfide reductase [Balneolaceae bacterium]|nr:TlpA family protein disulfide reductase [Balneolaceae bacterium]MBO6545028.1 TlpA family protein disulfide reductase [Balneolaceae bacterium]MBO6646424.1 TlpA family protein disulfide reductase [Balneolaceae bacterium]